MLHGHMGSTERFGLKQVCYQVCYVTVYARHVPHKNPHWVEVLPPKVSHQSHIKQLDQEGSE